MTTRTAFALVDAFTTARAFSGNPAGVVLLDDMADVAWMRGIANELAQAETAFLAPVGLATFDLRWFTPVAEVALCGHATLAAAHRLWDTGALPAHAPTVFETLSGRLTARREGDRIVLGFPAVPASPVPPYEGLLAALAGPVPVWTGLTNATDPGERNILAVLGSEDAVRGLTPDLRAVAALPAGGLIVTARKGDAVWSRATSRRHTASPRIPSPAPPTAQSARTGATSSARPWPPSRHRPEAAN